MPVSLVTSKVLHDYVRDLRFLVESMSLAIPVKQ